LKKRFAPVERGPFFFYNERHNTKKIKGGKRGIPSHRLCNPHQAGSRGRAKTLTYKWVPVLLLMGAMLGACGEEESNQAANSASDGETQGSTQETHTAEEEKAGGTSVKAPIEETENVPKEEREAILAALNQQIQSFNEKDIDAYMATISKTPESFDYEEEKAYIEKVFQTFDATMTPENTTIIQYDEDKMTANVFMNMESTSKDLSSGKEVSQKTRQIMVFQKEKDGWKQVSLFAME
jgi:ketosteroid isomerase-like protein